MTLILCPPYSAAPGDPHFNLVKALLKFDELPLVDVSPAGNVVTATAVTLNSDNPSRIAGSFNGSSSYLTLSPSAGRLGSANFTIEGWYTPRTTQLSQFPCIFGNYSSWGAGNGGLALFAGHVSSGRTTYSVAANGTFPALRSTSAIVPDIPVHLAVVRQPTSLTLFVGGKAEAVLTIAANTVFDGNGNVSIVGSAGDSIGQGYLNGLLRFFRITQVARYTTDFIPEENPPAYM